VSAHTRLSSLGIVFAYHNDGVRFSVCEHTHSSRLDLSIRIQIASDFFPYDTSL
jgi:hypothetical protein